MACYARTLHFRALVVVWRGGLPYLASVATRTTAVHKTSQGLHCISLRMKAIHPPGAEVTLRLVISDLPWLDPDYVLEWSSHKCVAHLKLEHMSVRRGSRCAYVPKYPTHLCTGFNGEVITAQERRQYDVQLLCGETATDTHPVRPPEYDCKMI